MGYIRHHAIIVTTNYAHDEIRQARRVAKDLGLDVSSVSAGEINAVMSFAVFPDGSKEGWPDSNEGDDCRDELIRYLNECEYEDGSSPFSWVEVQYGDDRGETKALRNSDDRYTHHQKSNGR